MNIAIYSRKSRYSEKGESIDNQILFCKDFADLHLSHLSDKEYIIYEDEGFSAANTKRPQFQKLLKDIKAGKIQVLMCYRLDRINRNVSDFSKTLELLEQYNVAFLSATENFDTSNPMGKAMIYIASVFAQLERETTAERVRDNMLALSRTGRWLGGTPPMGYHSESVLYLDENYKERQLYKLVSIESELQIVKLLFLKYIELKSLSQVEGYCLSNHIKTQNGCEFTKSTIALSLQNPTYCIADLDAYHYFKSLGCLVIPPCEDFDGNQGILSYNRTKHQSGGKQKKRPPTEWIIAIGKHKGIVSGKEFSVIGNLINQNKTKGAPRSNTSNIALLSGKIICGCCGSKLRIKNIRRKNNKISFSYSCEMKQLSKKTRCQMHNVSGALLDDLVIDIMKDLLSSVSLKSCYIPYLKEKETLILGTKQTKMEQIKNLQNDYNNINKKISNLMSQLIMSDSPLITKYILPQLEELDQTKQRIKTELDNLSLKDDSNQVLSEEILQTYHELMELDTLINNAALEQKKILINKMLHHIDWDGHNAFLTLHTTI